MDYRYKTRKLYYYLNMNGNIKTIFMQDFVIPKLVNLKKNSHQ